MAVIRELITLLRYQVDNSGLKQYATKAQAVGRQVSGLGRAAVQGLRQGTRIALAEYDLVPGRILKGIREQRRLNREQRRSAKNVRDIGGGYSAIGGYVRSALAALGTFQSARMIDEWSGIEARVGLTTDSIEEQQRALERLYAVSQESGQDYLATGDLFTAVQRNRAELELQLDQSLKLTDTIGKLMTIGGGSQVGQQAALIQLSQALGSGVLRGEELNSILEQAPRLAQAIAEAFGVSIGQLRSLGAEGKLTSKELVQGLLRMGEGVNDEFERMPKTFGRGMTIMRNAYGRFINQMNKASRVSERFYAVSKLIADNMAAIVKIGAFTALAAAMTKLRPLALGALGPFLKMAAVLAGLYLIGEDILVWTQGGHSLFGRWFGEYSQWQGTIDSVKGFLTYVKDMLGGSNEELSGWVKKWGAIALVVYALWRILAPIRSLLIWVGLYALPLIFKGFALLKPLAAFILRWILAPIVTAIAGVVGWPVVIAAAVATIAAIIYRNFESIRSFIDGIWDRVTDYFKDKWTAALGWLEDKLKKILPDSWVLSGEDASEARERQGRMRNPYADKMGALQRPQSFSPSQTNQITNETHIHAQTNNPSALANAAGQAVSRATDRVVSRRWTPPNVEALA